MANADFNRMLSRVVETLNACPSGTFQSVLDSRNKTRNIDALTAALTEAGLTVLQTLASMPNEFRSDFVSVTPINYGDFLPAHLGEPVKIEIQRYEDATWREADVKSKNYQQIESFRDGDGNIYDEIPHDQQDSALSGYADIWENKFYFTGLNARIGLANALRSDVATKIPEMFESTVIKLAIGNCPKAGDGSYTFQLAEWFTNQGRGDLAEFKAGKRVFAEVSAPAPDKQVHNG